MKARKDSVVHKIQKSLESLIQSNHVTIYKGHASFSAPYELKFIPQEGSGERITFDRAIIATGSEPIDIPAFRADHQKILNYSSALDRTKLPEKMAIVGGGYIGCEFASLFHTLGVHVTLIEALPSILPLQGPFLTDVMTKAFMKKGIHLWTETVVDAIDTTGLKTLVHCKNKEPLDVDIALVAIGRKAYTQGLGLEILGVQTNVKGEILVNAHMETNVPGIYAIGDVTGLYQLAHVASHQAIVAASHAAGKASMMHYHAVPSVIFTNPEIAMVGLTPEQAEKEGYAISVGKFPFQALGKAIAANETEGFAQIICDKLSGKILGAQVIGHEASSLIGEMALAIANECTIDSVTDTIHAHPTLGEAWLEAALLAQGSPIHFPPKKRSL